MGSQMHMVPRLDFFQWVSFDIGTYSCASILLNHVIFYNMDVSTTGDLDRDLDKGQKASFWSWLLRIHWAQPTNSKPPLPFAHRNVFLVESHTHKPWILVTLGLAISTGKWRMPRPTRHNSKKPDLLTTWLSSTARSAPAFHCQSPEFPFPSTPLDPCGLCYGNTAEAVIENSSLDSGNTKLTSVPP